MSEGKCEGMNPHTPKGASTLGVGVLMDSQIFKKRSQGSKPIGLKVFYIIRKLLKLKCLKWGRMTHLDIWNTSYGQKKGWESNWQFDSRPLKVRNQPDFLVCRWHATYCWKALDEGYNFALDLISIGGVHAKLWGPKIARVPTLAISGTKCHLDVGLVERHRVYTIRGKVVASPKSGPWWILWVGICPCSS
jgi:hypothetical protein